MAKVKDWEHQVGKKCLLCGKEELYYKHFGVGKSHCMTCRACNSNSFANNEEDAKRQSKNGGT